MTMLVGILLALAGWSLSRTFELSTIHAVHEDKVQRIQEQVLKREEWFLKKYNTNLWNERPDWFEIYNRQIN